MLREKLNMSFSVKISEDFFIEFVYILGLYILDPPKCI